MAPNKAPSHGQKVTLGQDAPVTREGTGAVAPDSLAAESEAFKTNNEATPSFPHENITSYAPRESKDDCTFRSDTGVSARHVDEAPTYISSQYFRDTAGPHGKNLKEDESIGTEDRAKNASFTEFGTKNDPGRLAEKKFIAMDGIPAAVPGARQTGIAGKTPYDVLGSQREA
jgi:hypothetical protein